MLLTPYISQTKVRGQCVAQLLATTTEMAVSVGRRLGIHVPACRASSKMHQLRISASVLGNLTDARNPGSRSQFTASVALTTQHACSQARAEADHNLHWL